MPAKTLDEYLKQATHKATKQQATKPEYKITGFYKETEFQETPIGKMPKGWSITKLRNVARINESKVNTGSLEGGVARIPMELIPDDGVYAKYVLTPINEIRSYVTAKVGDILLAKITPSFENGKQGIVPEDVPHGIALVTTEVYPITPTNIERLYLFYLLKWRKYRKLLESKMTGTTGRRRVPKKALEDLLIPLPSLEEQWGVAEVLSALDRAIEASERLIGRLERLKRGLMQELLTRGIGHKDFKETQIGRVPREWQVVRLGALFTFKNGRRPSVVREHGQIPIYGAGFIQGYTDDFMVDGDNVIIVARVGKGSAGKVYIASGKMWISDNAIYATPKNSLARPVFYYYLLQFLRLDKIAARSAAGGYSLITQSSLNNLHVPLPPRDEQEYIASTLSSLDEWIELEKRREEKFERLKRGLMKLLLTGRIRVIVATVGSSSSSFSGG